MKNLRVQVYLNNIEDGYCWVLEEHKDGEWSHINHGYAPAVILAMEEAYTYANELPITNN